MPVRKSQGGKGMEERPDTGLPMLHMPVERQEEMMRDRYKVGAWPWCRARHATRPKSVGRKLGRQSRGFNPQAAWLTWTEMDGQPEKEVPDPEHQEVRGDPVKTKGDKS